MKKTNASSFTFYYYETTMRLLQLLLLLLGPLATMAQMTISQPVISGGQSSQRTTVTPTDPSSTPDGPRPPPFTAPAPTGTWRPAPSPVVGGVSYPPANMMGKGKQAQIIGSDNFCVSPTALPRCSQGEDELT